MYDYLRIDDWHGQVMHFGVNLSYSCGDSMQVTSVDLSKSFDTGRREADFALEGNFQYEVNYGVYRVGTIKMHFQSYMYGNFGFGRQNDEAFHVTLTISSGDYRGLRLQPRPEQKLGSSIGLSWYADNNKNAGTRSWGIDNMWITQLADPVTTVVRMASVSTQPTPNAFVASNPTPIVGSSVVVSPLVSPVLAPTSDPTSFMGLTPDSAAASTSEVKASARLKPISFLAGLKNSQVAKRLLSLSGARKFT
jgi:hypothetical protein